MRASKFVVSTCCILASAAVCLAGKSLFFNSLGAVAVGSITTQPSDDPQGIIVTANTNIVVTPVYGEVWIPLNGIPSGTRIKGVKIYYYVTALSPGTTYITRVSLSVAGPLPDVMGYYIDQDPAVLSNTVINCHTFTVIKPGAKVDGPLMLELGVVFGNKNDQIYVGRIELF